MKLRIPVYLILLVIASCINNPEELNGQRTADCSHPTKPKDVQLDSNYVLVVEIYDFEQKLVNYSYNTDLHIPYTAGFDPANPNIDYYWNGYGNDKKEAAPGKYLVKISWFYKGKEGCSCSELIKRE